MVTDICRPDPDVPEGGAHKGPLCGVLAPLFGLAWATFIACGPALAERAPAQSTVSLQAAIASATLHHGSDHDFVLLSKHLPGLLVERPYETANNTFKTRLYDDSYCFLRRGTAKKLAKAAELLRAQGLKLKVWDAYRPLSVQRKMWKITPDKRYVAPPSGGSKHNRGAAVDVTLVTADGGEVEMPTGYDEFSRRAHHSYRGGTAESRHNREILKQAMLKAGFRPLSTEWWHWEDRDWRRYGVCDKTAEQIMR